MQEVRYIITDHCFYPVIPSIFSSAFFILKYKEMVKLEPQEKISYEVNKYFVMSEAFQALEKNKIDEAFFLLEDILDFMYERLFD